MILYTVIFLLLGLVTLYYGAKILVIALENTARRFGLSHLLIGLTILSIGTSLPEISVSVIGAIDKLSGIGGNIDDIVIGNKIGSFFINITLILGILGLNKSIFVSKWELKREGTMMFISIIIFYICAFDGTITRIEALLMIIAYVLYIIIVIKSEKKRQKIEEEIRAFIAKRDNLETKESSDANKDIFPLKKIIIFFIIGLIILLIGAEFALLSAVALANELDMPGSVIGIFVLGLGTSIPELAADLTALKRKNEGIAIGDILGSNICNLLLATGLGAIISEFNVPTILLIFDIPMLFFATGLVCYFLWSDNTLKRWEALLLICFFGFYALTKLTMFQM